MSIKLSNIYHTYSKGTPFERLALQDVSLEISKGEIVAIIGHTGSGKSTLVQHLNGLLKPDRGTAAIDDIDITAKGQQAKAARQQVGMVFQYPEHQIFAETVFEDIAFGPRNKGFNEEDVAKAVREAMAFVGLDYDTFAQRSPFQLSGGQMRRVAIAGVVAMNPDYLVLDEHKSRGIAIVLVTHSMEEAVKYANRLLVINAGKVLFDGEPAAIFKEHGAELVQVGVDVPQVYKLADLLRQKGLALPEGIKDEMALVKAIKQAKGWK